MNLKNSTITELRLSEQEKDDLKEALAHDKIIVPVLVKLLEKRLNRAEAKYVDYDKPNWPYRRAYKDGKVDELQLILKLYKDE